MSKLVQMLNERGFDESYKSRDGAVRVRCSQCDALVINGTPCHETGCPNTPRPETDDDDFMPEDFDPNC